MYKIITKLYSIYKEEVLYTSYIWSKPTRYFHWFFVLFILLSFLTADEDNLVNYHTIIGYSIIILLAFRSIWGIFGPKYTKFKDFPMSKKSVNEFLSNIFDNNQKFVGHNPLASYVIVAMFITTFFIILTGALALGIQEGKGIFSHLNTSLLKELELFEGIHEILSTILIILIVLHLSGISFDWLFHGKNKTLKSIINGFKQTKYNESIKLTISQKIISFIFLLLFISFLIFNFLQTKNILTTSTFIKNQTMNYSS